MSVYFLFVAPKLGGTDQENAAFLITGAVGVIPAIPFVVGRKVKSSGTFQERLRTNAKNLVATLRRMLFWMLGASSVSLILSLGSKYFAAAA
jgi:hypothetical protein